MLGLDFMAAQSLLVLVYLSTRIFLATFLGRLVVV